MNEREGVEPGIGSETEAPATGGPLDAGYGAQQAAGSNGVAGSMFTRHTLAIAGTLAGALVVAVAAAGAAVAHEFWPTTAVSTVAAPSTGGDSGTFGGSGSTGSGAIGGNVPGFGGGSWSFRLPPSLGSGSGSSSSASGSPSDVSGVAAKVAPGLVDINSSLSYQGAAAAGTGIVLTSDGKVLTNNHVIAGATKLTATDVGNGKTYSVAVLGYDATHDLALLQLVGASGLQTASLGDSSKLHVGDAVVGVGNAGGAGGTPSSAGGAITGLNKTIAVSDESGGHAQRLSNLIEVNAAIEPGDSGGSLVNANGEVIGIDTAGSSSGNSFGSAGGDAYAIPINRALATVKQIEAGKGSATLHLGDTAFLGISVASGSAAQSGDFGGFGGFGGGSQPSTGSVAGVGVAGVVSGLPAAKAGLTQGDTITSFDGKTVRSNTQISSALVSKHPGDSVSIGWTDASGSSHTASVKLTSGPPA